MKRISPLGTENWGSAIIFWKTFDELWARWLKSSLPAGTPSLYYSKATIWTARYGPAGNLLLGEPVRSSTYSFHLDGDYFIANSKERPKAFLRAKILVKLTSLWCRILSSRWYSLPEDRWFRKWRGIKHHKLKSFSSISQVRCNKKNSISGFFSYVHVNICNNYLLKGSLCTKFREYWMIYRGSWHLLAKF